MRLRSRGRLAHLRHNASHACWQAPNVALDRAAHVAMGLTVTVLRGVFDSCAEGAETPLEPNAKGTKIYCPGIGLVDDEGVRLVDFSIPPTGTRAKGESIENIFLELSGLSAPRRARLAERRGWRDGVMSKPFSARTYK